MAEIPKGTKRQTMRYKKQVSISFDGVQLLDWVYLGTMSQAKIAKEIFLIKRKAISYPICIKLLEELHPTTHRK